MASIGAAVGCIGYLMFLFISILSSIKFECMYWLVRHAGCATAENFAELLRVRSPMPANGVVTCSANLCRLFVAWVFNMAFSSLLVGVATWTVVEGAPAAAGLHSS